jgi:hypothetical protein
VTTHSTASEEVDVFRRVATVFAFLSVESGDQCLAGDERFQLDGEDAAEEGGRAEVKDLLILWQSVDYFPRLAVDAAEVDESLKIGVDQDVALYLQWKPVQIAQAESHFAVVLFVGLTNTLGNVVIESLAVFDVTARLV